MIYIPIYHACDMYCTIQTDKSHMQYLRDTNAICSKLVANELCIPCSARDAQCGRRLLRASCLEGETKKKEGRHREIAYSGDNTT